MNQGLLKLGFSSTSYMYECRDESDLAFALYIDERPIVVFILGGQCTLEYVS